MQHSISGMWVSLSPETIEWRIINLIFLISRCGVPVFFMCSGMGMLVKERSIESIFKKNIFGLIKIYVFWMLIYGVKDAISLIYNSYGIRIILNSLIKSIIFGQYHTWFIMTLFGLYLITPFLYEIVNKEKLMKYFIALSVLFTIIFPAICKLDGSGRLNTVFETFNMRFVVGYVMYYVLGYYIGHSFNFSYIMNRKKALTTTIILCLGSIFTAFMISCTVSVKSGEPFQDVYGEFAPLGLVMNISILMLFQLLITAKKHGKLIFKLGSCGVSIYLMHPLLLPIASFFSGISRIWGGIAVYIAALIISLILNQLKGLKLKKCRIKKL
ncbi:MAG: acyltransferase family protein [Clostridiales bacterium]|nr:acyltransferase family protein [Clostridiales bacterium]